MATTATGITSTVRGLVIDIEEAGVEGLFSDAEILSAINSTKNDFFGIRPEAFSVSTIATAPPADVETGGSLDIQPWALQQFCYGVATFLLFQRGKDAYFRKAADTLRKIYLGG